RITYLDSAVSSQMPVQAIERMRRYMSLEHTNVHRGVSRLSQEATDQYEVARERVRALINAHSSKQVIWTRGATESINLVAQSWGRMNIEQGDEILLSAMEHHSNIVPWQLLAEEKRAVIRVIPMNDEGELSLDALDKLITDRTKLIGVTHVSNVLGTVNPLKEIIETAHSKGVPVLVDGAQSVPHMKVDVQNLDADFFVFSGHKMCGPTGIGVLYAKRELLDAMPPWQGGGSMILSVEWEKTQFMPPPAKFEAGTPNITAAIGLGASIDYLNSIGMDEIAAWEHHLLETATEKLMGIQGLRIIGSARDKASVLSFVLKDIHPHDVGSILDLEGVVVRAGHHCAQPVMKRFSVPATTRASFAFYNNEDDIEALVSAIHKVKEIFL
ncbi:MAG: cysteine desulfurase, partial [Holophagales bacterium]|nr:cysteine desulfurase [Holophagales bacterium]